MAKISKKLICIRIFLSSSSLMSFLESNYYFSMDVKLVI